MGYQENLELYLNLSRRELQGLCKNNNLPANRSHTELAISLASLFKKKNDSPAPLKDRLNTPVELSYRKTNMLDTKSNGTTNPSEDNTKGSDSHKVAPFMKEKGGDHRQHTSTGNQMEISTHVGSKAVENAYNIASNAVFPNNEVPQLFASTTSGDGNGSPETDGRLNSKCNADGTNSGAQRLPEQKKFGQKLLNRAASKREAHKLASAQNTQPGATECHSKSGFLSPKGNVTKATPSFQFFVECDEGFHLFVDLNSRPSEWVSSLKDGVHESLKSQQYKSRALPIHFGDFAAVDGSLKISTPENIGINLQSNGDWNSGCTASTLSSVSDICQSVGSQPDATIVSSESSVLTSSRLPVEMSGGLDGNQVISSSFATHSNVQKIVPFDTTHSPENGIDFPQNLIDSSRMDECNTLRLDTLVKPIGSISGMSPEAKRQLECPTPNNAVDGSSSIGANTSGHRLGSCFEIENDYTTSDNLKIGNGTCHVSKERGPKEGSLEGTGNHSRSSSACQLGGQLIFDRPVTEVCSCHGSKERGPKEGSLEVTGNHSRSSSACQLGGQVILDHPVTEVQSDAGLADHLLSLHACVLGDLIAKDPVAALNDELDKMTPVKEIENLPGENSKRSHSAKFQEEFQNKRHQSNDGNKSGMVVNLRSARTSAKETISERVLRPRRSSRLLTK